MNRYIFIWFWLAFVFGATGCASIKTPKQPFPNEKIDTVATKVVDILTAAAVTPTPVDVLPNDKLANLVVVYEKSGNLWFWRENKTVQLSETGKDQNPQFSTDGKWIVFQRGNELWVMDQKGENLKKVFNETGSLPWQFGFKPASHIIYFSTTDSGRKPHYDLNLVDLEDGVVKKILQNGLGGEFKFAPDGRMLALVRPGQIAVMQADANTAKVVYSFGALKSVAGEYLPHIAWMKDGSGFKTVIPGLGGKPAKFLYIMASGGQPAQLAEFYPVPLDIADTYISPDGTKILYAKVNGSALEARVIDVSTSDNLHFSYALKQMGILGWTPDSNSILFWKDDPRKTWKSTGSIQEPVADVASAEHVTWITSNNFLFKSGLELRFFTPGSPSTIIDSNVTGIIFAASDR